MQLKYQNLSYDQTDVNETWYVYLLTKYLYICKLRYWGPLMHIELSHSLIYTLLLLLFFLHLSIYYLVKIKSEKFWSQVNIFYVSLESIYSDTI